MTTLIDTRKRKLEEDASLSQDISEPAKKKPRIEETKEHEVLQRTPTKPLTEQQIEFYKKNGYLVVPDVFSKEEVKSAADAFKSTLKAKFGSVPDDGDGRITTEMAKDMLHGGVMHIYYPSWKIAMQLQYKVHDIYAQLWEETYGKNDGNTKGWLHPYGACFDKSMIAEIDRVGYRPGNKEQSSPTKPRSAELGLKYHVDFIPGEEFPRVSTEKQRSQLRYPVSTRRWRPFQSFIAISDNSDTENGGLELLPGFHLQFEEWYAKNYAKSSSEFTVLSGNNAFKKLQKDCISVPYSAGSVVIWDYRTPHRNARSNKGPDPRYVIYGTYLPKVDVNVFYAERQREHYSKSILPPAAYPRKMTHYSNRRKVMGDVNKEVPELPWNKLSAEQVSLLS